VIRPRRRKEEASPEGLEIESDASPVVITREVLSSLFSLPLSAAADRLRISVTSLKKICRSFGVRLWPYRFQQYQDKLSSDPAQASAEVGVCAAQNGCGGTENGGSAAEVNAWSASARDGEWTRGNVGSVPGAVPAVPTPRFAAPATNLSTWEHAPTGVYHTLHHHVDAERRVWHHSVTEQRRPDPDGRSDSSASFRNQATLHGADAPGTLAPATRSELCSDEELRVCFLSRFIT